VELYSYLGSIMYNHCKIGGEWKRMIVEHKIGEGTRIKLGAPMVGKNETVYLEVYREMGF